jgi:hypothetical protein
MSSDTEQLIVVVIHIVFIWSSELAASSRRAAENSSYRKTTREDTFQSSYSYGTSLEINIPHKRFCQLLDATSAMTNENVGFIGCCIKDPTFPDFTTV